MSTKEQSNKERFVIWSEKLYGDLMKMGVDMEDDRTFLLVKTSITAFLKDKMKPMVERLQREVQKIH